MINLETKKFRKIFVPATEYVCPITHARYVQSGYTAHVSETLLYAPRTSYEQMLKMLPKGYRMPIAEPIAELLRLEKTNPDNPRKALEDKLFDYFFERNGKPYRWERTHAALCAPEGKRKMILENRPDGKKDLIFNYKIGDKTVAENVRIKASSAAALDNGKIVAWNEALLLPAEVSDDQVPGHTAHVWINPDLLEADVALSGSWFNCGHNRCLIFSTCWGWQYSNDYDAFRLVKGSLEDVPLPRVEVA